MATEGISWSKSSIMCCLCVRQLELKGSVDLGAQWIKCLIAVAGGIQSVCMLVCLCLCSCVQGDLNTCSRNRAVDCKCSCSRCQQWGKSAYSSS